MNSQSLVNQLKTLALDRLLSEITQWRSIEVKILGFFLSLQPGFCLENICYFGLTLAKDFSCSISESVK